MLKRLVVTVCLVFVAATASAQEFGVRYARTLDGERNVVGVDLKLGRGAWSFNPSIEYWLDTPTAFLLNADVNYNFNPGGVNPFIGVGAGVARFEDILDFEEDETEYLANVNGGVEFRTGTLTPYVQARYFRFFEDESDDIAVILGLRF